MTEEHPSGTIGETHRKSSFARPFDLRFRTMAAYSVRRAKCPLQAVCTVRLARAQAVISRSLKTEIHVESIAFVIGRRRFMYVLAICRVGDINPVSWAQYMYRFGVSMSPFRGSVYQCAKNAKLGTNIFIDTLNKCKKVPIY